MSMPQTQRFAAVGLPCRRTVSERLLCSLCLKVVVVGVDGQAEFFDKVTLALLPAPFGLTNGVFQMACGADHCIALGYDGLVMSAGDGRFGQLGTGQLTPQETFEPLLDAEGISKERIYRVWCGPNNSGALSSSGSLYTWGSNSEGQCGVGTLADVTRCASRAFAADPTADPPSDERGAKWRRPTQVKGVPSMTQLAMGRHHCLGVDAKAILSHARLRR